MCIIAAKQQITVCVTKFTTKLNVFVGTQMFFRLSASRDPDFIHLLSDSNLDHETTQQLQLSCQSAAAVLSVGRRG